MDRRRPTKHPADLLWAQEAGAGPHSDLNGAHTPTTIARAQADNIKAICLSKSQFPTFLDPISHASTVAQRFYTHRRFPGLLILMNTPSRITIVAAPKRRGVTALNLVSRSLTVRPLGIPRAPISETG